MITITNIAKQKLLNLIKNEGTAAFLYLKGGGCNGFSYKFKILKDESKINKFDEVLKIEDKNLYLCNKSLMYLIGTKVDYIEDIMGSRFDFKNENIESKCSWSPFNGYKFKGTPTHTIIAGKIKMQDGKILGDPEGKPLVF